MTDYKEEQNNEIEALESIYPEEFLRRILKRTNKIYPLCDITESCLNIPSSLFTANSTDWSRVLETEPHHKFQITVKTEGGGEGEEATAAAEICLTFQYTATYPDQPPVLEVTPIDNIEDEDLKELRQRLDDVGAYMWWHCSPWVVLLQHPPVSQYFANFFALHHGKNPDLTLCSDNLGMVMVFSVVTSALEWLTSHMESLARTALQAKQDREKQQEEAERKKFEGTRVTVETFLAWKAKFDAEMALLRSEREREEEKNRKLSGRQLFQRDQTLNQSDLSFLGDGEGEVAVDESLFQDLDDLELEDELDDEDLDD